MNKDTLRKLINKVKRSPFNWARPEMCLEYYAQELLGDYNTGKLDSLEKFLEISEKDAALLYGGKRISCGQSFFRLEEWCEAHLSYGKPYRGHKKVAVEYLESLL